jgi:hypothetical protein
VAILKSKLALGKAQLLFYALCVRANRYRYSFGRQANRTLWRLPVPSLEEIPEWVTEANFERFTNADMARRDSPPPPLPDTSDWRGFQLRQLFEIRKGKRLTKANMLRGSTPFIGAIDSCNGITGFIRQHAIHSANTITVNYNGNGVAEAFYQPVPFWCSDDVNVLYPKFRLTPAIALFIATVIRREKFRYSYGRKWDLDRMRPSVIRLPIAPSGEPDWGLMEAHISSLPFSSQL